MKEIALVLAVGNLIALNLLVIGVLVIAYRTKKVNAEPAWVEYQQPESTQTLPWPAVPQKEGK